MGDSDRKVWIIASIGGLIGGLVGGAKGAMAATYIPAFVYQLGLPDVSNEMGLGDSQASKGFSRAFVAALAAAIPCLAGWLLGWVVSSIVS